MTTEWVINASLTHQGIIHHPQGLRHNLQGIQHHQHRQQGGGSKIKTCGYMDLVNWIQGVSRHKESLYRLKGIGCEDTGIIHSCALQEGLGDINN